MHRGPARSCAGEALEPLTIAHRQTSDALHETAVDRIMILRHFLSHDLDPAQAKEGIDSAFAYYQSRYPGAALSLGWRSDREAGVSFRARGFLFKATLLLRPTGIDLALDLPLIFGIFHKRALRVIDAEASRWLERARSGKTSGG